MRVIVQREFEILEIIKKNPFISQKEIGEKLNIDKFSVAGHITNLIHKGLIKDGGYVIDKKDYISVIGGANVDIVGYPFEKLKESDSNPGQVNVSIGGVGRNIAENLVKLGNYTKMFTVVGEDVHGEKIIKESQESGIDMNHVKKTLRHGTGTYLAVLNEKKDMAMAIASMDCFLSLDEAYINENKEIISKSKAIVLDTNLEEDVFQYVVNTFKENLLFLDTVSCKKALRAKKVIGYFHTIKPNKIEAETLSGIKISNEKDLEKVANYFHREGVINVFITLGEEGVFYSDSENKGMYKVGSIIPKNATGAGDAFQAALVHSQFNGMDIEEKTQFAVASSILAMGSYSTINPEMSVEKIRETIKKMEEGKNE